MAEAKYYDEVGAIIDYESGQLSDAATLELFAHLIANGHAWSLQGSYGREARALIEAGLLTSTGEITAEARVRLADLEVAES